MKKPPTYPPLYPFLGGTLARGELVIDNFAGWGGASTGMEAALGRPVDHAINHDPVAVSMHRVNHPHSHHSVEDVWQVHPLDVTGGQPVALAWFSPTCTHFSKAKGGALLDRKIRGLAWVALRWAHHTKPRVIVVENVEEFQGWGPLLPSGRPDPKQSGRTFRTWVNALRYQGYEVEWRELRACDYGAPTIRKRLFVVARRDGQPIVWPEPTHADPADPRVQAGQLLPYRTAAECIDWDLPAPSIFDRKKPLVRNTLNRVAQGLRRYVLQSDRPFIVTCNHSGPGFRGQTLDRPMNTITAAHEAHGLILPHLTKFNTGSTGQSVDAPIATIVAGGNPARESTGNTHGLVAAHLVQHNGGSLPPADASYPIDRPARTVLAQGGPQGLVTGALLGIDNASSAGSAWDAQRPLTTIVTEARHALTAAHLTAYYSADGKGDVGQAVDEPARTIPTRDRFGPVLTTLAPVLGAAQLARAREVHAFLLEFIEDALLPYSRDGLVVLQVRGEWYILADIGMRMLTPRELARCQGVGDSFVLDTTAEGKPVSKSRQVRGLGNMVCPAPAEAITRAQLSAVLEQAAD
ncbi:DNA cytosine methyltransferase [Deinococcus sp. 6GRE01]|uniref:DNA cytosine methyltransferase n=1 Tax=Deinococcus sp. 6GRE01 TaxID=2745873 RepID=UPI001E383AEA|nr:DNA cytosine methyltransferase [Deinococcus sp. 6GRE01]MCD0155985.1 DNA cytosine methyltransferase [Deinococcus sp. 6GRE01]